MIASIFFMTTLPVASAEQRVCRADPRQKRI
jgi:hypothetical protein